LAWLSGFARTPLGRDRLLALGPSSDSRVVAEQLALVEEARRALDQGGALVPGLLPDPRAAIQALAVEGVGLDGKAVRDLAIVLEAALALGERLRRLPPRLFPRLGRLGQEIPDLRAECAPVLRGTDPEGRLLDEASPELGRLRQHQARVGERLRQMLERHLRDPAAESLIRDEFVTRRNGRFVIPMRADAPRTLRGIVHARSSSGATHFVEPFEAVELNNELINLAEAEREEERRILAAWSAALRNRLADARAALEALGRGDSLQARARFAEACGATVPQVAAGSRLRLEGLRHPLLQRRLSAEGGECVPATFVLDPADRVLVLSGPNTGGKTVALKALGLAVLMAQAGIPVAASLAELPAYLQVRADIGDHQSIAADLSTYSSHVRAVAAAIRRPRLPALFLFDEIGTGTEPAEGGALARAILESLVRPGLTVVVTTHLAPVKAWGVTAEGACSASLDLDPQTLAPTYRVRSGSAGRSAGIDIAERLGLDAAIVARARALVEPTLREGEEYLARLAAALGQAAEEAERLRRTRLELEAARASDDARARSRAEAWAREARQTFARAVGEFRRLARKEIDLLAEPAERRRAERRLERVERRLAAEGTERAAQLGNPEAPAPQRATPLAPEDLVAGGRVWVASLGREGELQGVRGREAEVRLGGVVFRTRVEDLGQPPELPAGPGPEPARPAAAPERACPSELLLVGRHVEEALEQLDRFLDAARLTGHEEVRIVHGHGTGRLRVAVRRFLAEHAFVRSQRPGREGEGGDGATVARLL